MQIAKIHETKTPFAKPQVTKSKFYTHSSPSFTTLKGIAMNFDALNSIPPMIQLHAISALSALALGPFVIFRKKRDRLHKYSGYVWMLAMLQTALTSFWITEITPGSFSPVHLLSVLTIATIIYSIYAAAKGDIETHKWSLHNLYFFGTAGAFTVNFLPQRTIPAIFFEGGGWLVFAVALCVIAGFVVMGHVAFKRQISVGAVSVSHQ